MKLRRVLSVFLFCHAAVAQIALVAHTSSSNTSNGTGTINTTGANFYAVCETGPYGPIAPTDSIASNNYTLVASAPLPGYWGTFLYVAYNPTTGTAEKWTVNGGGYPATVEAFSGVAGFDQATGATGGSPVQVPSLTPALANELLFGCYHPEGTAPGLTVADSTGGQAGITAAYAVQTTATPVAAVWSQPNGNAGAAAGITASFFSTLSPAPLVANTLTLSEAVVGQQYSVQLTASGGVAPYHFGPSASAILNGSTAGLGALPPGLSISDTGLLSGTPTATGSSVTGYSVADSKGTTAYSQALTLTVAAQPLAIATPDCPTGTQYQVYAGCSIVATGGTAPYVYHWAGDIPWTGQLPPANGNYAALPEGLTLDAATGRISGTENGMGFYTVLFVVTDASGSSVTLPYQFAMNGGPAPACSFPADSIYYADVSNLPVDTSQFAPIPSDYINSNIRLGFGPYGNGPNGIPFFAVPGSQPMVAMNTGNGPFPGGLVPFPLNPPMEGTVNSPNPELLSGDPNLIGQLGYTGDNHVIVLKLPDATHTGCQEFDSYDNFPNVPKGATSFAQADGTWGTGTIGGPNNGYSGSYFDLTKYDLNSATGQQLADEGGMPIWPLLENVPEVNGTGTSTAPNGVVREPKRFTLTHTNKGYVPPAVHQAGSGTCTNAANPYGVELLDQDDPTVTCSQGGATGEIYRLKASAPDLCPAATNPQGAIIEKGFRVHGIILGDNGLPGMVTGTPDPGWNMADIPCLTQYHLSDFEPVKTRDLFVNWPLSSQVVALSATPPPVTPPVTTIPPDTPTTPSPAPTTSVVITVTDSTGASKSTPAITVPVNPAPAPPITVPVTSLPPFTIGIPYSFQVSASGGVGALSYSATGLPGGVSIDRSSGLISGTPSQ